MSEGPLSERSDQQITDDVVACLKQVGPVWVRLMDPITLPLHVRDELDEMERLAREHGRAGTGCMVVEYDSDEQKMTWSVVVGSRFDPEVDE